MCECKRIVSINGKCNDLSYMTIKHLDFEHDGYMPYVGKLGGDYINLDICLDCGKIQGWQPVTDEDIKATDEYQEKFGDAEEEEDDDSPSVITLAALQKPLELSEEQKIASEYRTMCTIIEHAFGRNWRADPKVKRWIQVNIDSPENVNPDVLKSLQQILDEL